MKKVSNTLIDEIKNKKIFVGFENDDLAHITITHANKDKNIRLQEKLEIARAYVYYIVLKNNERVGTEYRMDEKRIISRLDDITDSIFSTENKLQESLSDTLIKSYGLKFDKNELEAFEYSCELITYQEKMVSKNEAEKIKIEYNILEAK